MALLTACRRRFLPWFAPFGIQWAEYMDCLKYRSANFIRVEKAFMIHTHPATATMMTDVTAQFQQDFETLSTLCPKGREYHFSLDRYDVAKSTRLLLPAVDFEQHKQEASAMRRFLVVEYLVNNCLLTCLYQDIQQNQLLAYPVAIHERHRFPPTNDFSVYDTLACRLPPSSVTRLLLYMTEEDKDAKKHKQELNLTDLLQQCMGPMGILSYEPKLPTDLWITSPPDCCQQGHTWPYDLICLYAILRQSGIPRIWLSAMNSGRMELDYPPP